MSDQTNGTVDLLAQPLRLPCGVTLPNRIVKAALSEGLATSSNNPDERLFTLYRRWSEGGAGLLLTGNAMVSRNHLDRPGNVVIDGKEDRQALAQWAKAGRVGGNELWMQINHTGRQTGRYFNPEPMSPSDVAVDLGDYFAKPRPMTEEQIVDVIGRLGRAAAVAREAGFTGVQLHGAHGYLTSQFLSPRTNQRTDAWGGSLQNRARFLLETLRAMRASVGADFPVGVKLNSADFQKGGFNFDECLQVVRWLNDESIDLLEVSGGTYEQMSMAGEGKDEDGRSPVKESTRQREAYFLEYADAIRQVAKMPLMVTGGFRTRTGMESALRSGATDLVGLGRPLCVEPDLPRRLLSRQTDSALGYERRLDSELHLVPKVDAEGKPQFVTTLIWFNHQIVVLGDGRDAEPDLPLVDGLTSVVNYDTAKIVAWENPATAAA